MQNQEYMIMDNHIFRVWCFFSYFYCNENENLYRSDATQDTTSD